MNKTINLMKNNETKVLNLYQKLAQAKTKIGKISKDSKNPFFNSKYFDINQLLEHVEPILLENNLLLLQPIKEGCISTEIIDIETQEKISSCLNLPALTDPQKIIACCTYYRRATLQSLLAIQAEDDDGNKAAQKAPTKKRLDQKGFDFLMSEGTKEQIETALKTRIINKPWSEELNNQLVVIKNQ